MTEQFEGLANRASTRAMVLAFLIICLGLLVVALPLVSSIGVVLGIGVLMIATGAVHFINTFDAQSVGHTLWKVLIAIAYLLAGIYLVTHLIVGLAGITLALAAFFFAKGIIDIAAYFSRWRAVASGWMLVDGIVTILLGVMIWRQWPVSSLWVLGTLVGIGLVFSGASRLMMALSLRESLRGRSDSSFQDRRAA